MSLVQNRLLIVVHSVYKCFDLSLFKFICRLRITQCLYESMHNPGVELLTLSIIVLLEEIKR